MYRHFLALRYLRSRLVNLIAVCGVMFGVGVLIVVTCVMDGFRAKVLTVLRGNLSDLVLTPLHGEDEALPAFTLVDSQLREDARVHAVSPQVHSLVFYLYPAYGRGQMQVEGHAVRQMQAVGIDFEREKRVSKIESYLVSANDRKRPFHSHRAIDREKDTLLISRKFAEDFLHYVVSEQIELPDDPDVVDAYAALIGVEPKPGETFEAFRARVEDSWRTRQDPYLGLRETDFGLTFVHFGGGGSPAGGPDGAPQEDGGPSGPGQGSARASWRTYNLVISGVYDGEDQTADKFRVYLDIDVLRRLADIKDEYTELRVKLKDPGLAPQVKADLTERFKDENGRALFAVTTWKDHRADYLKAVNNEKVLLVIVLSFIVLLGGFVILATLTLTVVEKTRDIGVLAALGATRNGILSLFVGNGLMIGLVGSALGVALGWLFTKNVNNIKEFLSDKMGIQLFPADIYLFREIPTIWDWSSVAWIVGGSVFMAFFAGFIPALRAARMDPIRALRYE